MACRVATTPDVSAQQPSKSQRSTNGTTCSESSESSKSPSQHLGGSRVCVLCTGSCGDVLPIANVILGVLGMTSAEGERVSPKIVQDSKRARVFVSFITHQKFVPILEQLFRAKDVEVVGVDIPVLFGSVEVGQKRKRVSSSKENDRTPLSEMTMLYEEVVRTKSSLLVYNMATLVGFHIAEALQIPSLILSPGIIPPQNDKYRKACEKILQNQPFLRFALESKPKCSLQHRGDDSTRFQQMPHVSRIDIEHWMAPLWLEHYLQFRSEVLGLPKLPLSLRSVEHKNMLGLPRATPVLYGIAQNMLPLPKHIPDHIQTCGYWLFPTAGFPFSSHATRKFEHLHKLAKDSGRKIVFICFGSMADVLKKGRFFLKFKCDLQNLLEKIASKMKEYLLILHLPGDAEHQYSQNDTMTNNNTKLELIQGFLNHQVAFREASVVIHHGGAQTTGQVIMAKRPQIVLPFWCDQHYWAERVQSEGIGISLAARDIRNEDVIMSAIRNLTKPELESEFNQKCEKVAKMTGGGEMGIKHATKAIIDLLASNSVHGKCHDEL